MAEQQVDEGALHKVAWLRASKLGFGAVPEGIEFPHREVGTDAFSATETWWFEIIGSAHDLIASFYITVRPNLGVCSAGAWIWRGHCRDQILADHLNYQIYLPPPVVNGSVISVPQVGLSFDIIEPLQRFRVLYAPPGLDCEAALEVRALMPPAMRSNGKHFEQAIWATGSIRIGADIYPIDGPSFRDRSFGEARPEDQISHPPIGWLSGTLDGGAMAFNLSGCDDPARHPAWEGIYRMDPAASFYDGWLMRDGTLRRVVSMSKRTTRLACERMRPELIEVDFVDDAGEAHHLVGRPRSSYWMHHWPNVFSWFGLTDWELDGRHGFGEAQDYAWPDYIKRVWPLT